MYQYEAHLQDGRKVPFQHHDGNANVEALKRVAETAAGSAIGHMIVKIVSKGRAK